jgi:hypothetical protein
VNTLEILGREGHISVAWDPDNPEEVEKARAEFNRLLEAGFMLFVVTAVKEFPEGAGEVTAELVAAPPPLPAGKPDPSSPPATARGEQTRKFQPKAKRTVAVRPMQGG